MYKPPRYYLVSADRFDASTALADDWQPDDTNPNTPRHAVTVEVLGRLSFRDLMRPGTAGAVVMVRRWGPPGPGPDQIGMRSVSTAENALETLPDDPPPIDVDQLLETRPLAKEWSRPFFMGPTDALTIGWLPNGGGTVEIVVAEIDEGLLAAQIQALIGCCGGDDEYTSIVITGDTTIAAWSGTLYALVETPGGATVVLPPMADVEVNGRLLYMQTDGSSAINCDGAETINGRTAAAVALGTTKIVTRTPHGWSTTETAEDPQPTVLANLVAGDTVDVPPWTGFKTFLVNWRQWGNLQLPDAALCGSNAEALFQRDPNLLAGEALARLLPFGTQTINEGANKAVFAVPLAPRSMRLKRRIDGDWVLTMEGSEVPVETVAAGNKTYASAWPGRRYLRLTNAGAQTVTLPTYTGAVGGPPFAPIDCELVVIYTGAAAATVQRADAAELIRGGGANGASVAVPPDTVGVFRFNGTEWLSQVA